MTPDHLTRMDSDQHIFGVTSSVDNIINFASKGEAERESLRMDEGLIYDAIRRLQNLVHTLGTKEAA